MDIKEQIKKLNKENPIDKRILSNGLKVIFDHNPQINSMITGVFINKGSRDENISQLGYSHFCEHMLFKGTRSLNKKEIAINFDKMGGYFNAYTSQESVEIFSLTPSFYAKENISLILDILNNSIFIEKELELEREVILNEINQEFEDPQEKIHEDFMKNLFPDHPIGRPIIGNKASIIKASQEKLFNFYEENFTLENLLVIISGNYNEKEILNVLLNYNYKTNLVTHSSNEKLSSLKSNYAFTKLPSEQVHLLTGTRDFNYSKDEFFKIGILNLILGESMSSRFFQKLREDEGLCYSVYSFFNYFRSERIFGVYLSLLPENLNKAIKVIESTIKDLKSKGITAKELEYAKEQKIVELIINNDILKSRMQKIAFMELTLNKHLFLEEIISSIEELTLQSINDDITRLFNIEKFFTQFLYKKKLKFKELIF